MIVSLGSDPICRQRPTLSHTGSAWRQALLAICSFNLPRQERHGADGGFREPCLSFHETVGEGSYKLSRGVDGGILILNGAIEDLSGRKTAFDAGCRHDDDPACCAHLNLSCVALRTLPIARSIVGAAGTAKTRSLQAFSSSAAGTSTTLVSSSSSSSSSRMRSGFSVALTVSSPAVSVASSELGSAASTSASATGSS